MTFPQVCVGEGSLAGGEDDHADASARHRSSHCAPRSSSSSRRCGTRMVSLGSSVAGLASMPDAPYTDAQWSSSTVYPDGNLCISILHEPEVDQYGYEDAGERWLPVHTLESIVCVVSVSVG